METLSGHVLRNTPKPWAPSFFLCFLCRCVNIRRICAPKSFVFIMLSRYLRHPFVTVKAKIFTDGGGPCRDDEIQKICKNFMKR